MLALVRRSECVLKSRGSRPISVIQIATSRAYCLVDKDRFAPLTPGEKELPGLPTGRPKVFVDGVASVLDQFELDGLARLLLPNRRTIDRVAARRDVLNFDCYDVAAAQLAVDSQLEHR
jgi:hypothetical protein